MGHYGGAGLIPDQEQQVKGSSVAATVALARIQSLAQELPHAEGSAIKLKKEKREKEFPDRKS